MPNTNGYDITTMLYRFQCSTKCYDWNLTLISTKSQAWPLVLHCNPLPNYAPYPAPFLFLIIGQNMPSFGIYIIAIVITNFVQRHTRKLHKCSTIVETISHTNLVIELVINLYYINKRTSPLPNTKKEVNYASSINS